MGMSRTELLTLSSGSPHISNRNHFPCCAQSHLNIRTACRRRSPLTTAHLCNPPVAPPEEMDFAKRFDLETKTTWRYSQLVSGRHKLTHTQAQFSTIIRDGPFSKRGAKPLMKICTLWRPTDRNCMLIENEYCPFLWSVADTFNISSTRISQ